MSTINVRVTSNLQSFFSERRFPSDMTVTDLKQRLELLTGASSTSMQVELRSKDNLYVSTLSDGGATLAQAGVCDGAILHANDVGALVDTSAAAVHKFELSDEAYENRSDSVRAWKQREKLGRFAAQQADENGARGDNGVSQEAPADVKVGARCEVRLSGQTTGKRGTVAYVGETRFQRGVWVGVRYDEPLGKNDGSVAGHRYFECTPNYGGFVRPKDLVVGDFPEIPIDEDMDEI